MRRVIDTSSRTYQKIYDNIQHLNLGPFSKIKKANDDFFEGKILIFGANNNKVAVVNIVEYLRSQTVTWQVKVGDRTNREDDTFIGDFRINQLKAALMSANVIVNTEDGD